MNRKGKQRCPKCRNLRYLKDGRCHACSLCACGKVRSATHQCALYPGIAGRTTVSQIPAILEAVRQRTGKEVEAYEATPGNWVIREK